MVGRRKLIGRDWFGDLFEAIEAADEVREEQDANAEVVVFEIKAREEVPALLDRVRAKVSGRVVFDNVTIDEDVRGLRVTLTLLA